MAAHIQILQRAFVENTFFRDNTNPLDYMADDELFRNYRFTRQGIFFLIDTFGGALSRRTLRNRALPPSLQLLIALRFYATGTS